MFTRFDNKFDCSVVNGGADITDFVWKFYSLCHSKSCLEAQNTQKIRRISIEKSLFNLRIESLL